MKKQTNNPIIITVFDNPAEYSIWVDANCNRCKLLDECKIAVEMSEDFSFTGDEVRLPLGLSEQMGHKPFEDWNCILISKITPEHNTSE